MTAQWVPAGEAQWEVSQGSWNGESYELLGNLVLQYAGDYSQGDISGIRFSLETFSTEFLVGVYVEPEEPEEGVLAEEQAFENDQPLTLGAQTSFEYPVRLSLQDDSDLQETFEIVGLDANGQAQTEEVSISGSANTTSRGWSAITSITPQSPTREPPASVIVTWQQYLVADLIEVAELETALEYTFSAGQYGAFDVRVTTFSSCIAAEVSNVELQQEPSCETGYNCACEDDPAARTLASMRSELIARLGYTELKAAQTTRTLAELRLYLMRRLGFSAQAANPPPGMTDLLDELINEAQDTVWRRYGYDLYTASAPTRMEEGTDTCTVDAMALQLLALANGKAHYGQDAKPFYEQYERYFTELLARRPLNLESRVDSILRSAQEQVYHRFESFKTERFFTWNIEEGVRYYGLRENNDCCEDVQLDAYHVSWVGVEDDAGVWYELTEGIPPELYTTSENWRGCPSRYEIRECIEIFPAPAADVVKLRIKGHFGLKPFSSDAHTTTVDPNVLHLWALGIAKEEFGQPGASVAFQQANDLIGRLVAGSHHTARYVPGRRAPRALPRPRFLPLEE